MTFKKILVALDGSTNSEKALAPVAGIALKMKAEMVLLAATGPDVTVQGEARTQSPAKYLELQAAPLREQGLTVKTLIENAAPVEAILTVADRESVDLIAMATHRENVIERGILGSVTDTVLRTANHPVLAINPDGDGMTGATPWTPSTVIVPLDGSELGERSVPHALEIAKTCGADLIFMQAVHLPSYAVAGPGAEFYGIEYGVSAQREAARNYLEKFVEQAEAMGLSARSHASLGNAAARIVEECRGIPGALIVISSHGRGGFKRMLLGSVADKIIRASHHPVLVLKHGQSEDAVSECGSSGLTALQRHQCC